MLDAQARCGGCLAVAGKDMVLALQTELPQEVGSSTQQSAISAEKREQAGLLSIDPRDPTRAIIGGLANAMTGECHRTISITVISGDVS